jgi:gliding motility-associated-like protein
MFKRQLILFCLAFVSWNASSQNQAAIWYFGHNAGISFSSGSPLGISGGQIFTDEGVATISDNNGQLLFYTDGTKIWNRLHQQMPNGTGLFGSFSSTQSAIIVPFINDPRRYYVFTVEQLARPNGFCYSVVNMNLDNGNGDVEVKNRHLRAALCEKLTAVNHCNGKDIWVIVHDAFSNTFYAYLVSETGISLPVTSNAGSVINAAANIQHTLGYLKASPDGTKLAAANYGLGVDLLDFNNVTGVVSNARTAFSGTDPYAFPFGPYGIEFSPNSKLLYVAGDYFENAVHKSILLQYNAISATSTDLQASKNVIYNEVALLTGLNFGALQLGPDYKIYLSAYNQSSLSVINNPNSSGISCNYGHGQVPLYPGTINRYGLPTFIQSFYKPTFTFDGQCRSRLVQFFYERLADVDSVVWSFGDPPSGINNIARVDSPQHTFTSNGIYNVRLIRYSACGNDTLDKQITVDPVSVNLGADTLLCNTTQFTIIPQVSANVNSYLWQDGSNGNSFTSSSNGIYWLEVTTPIGCVNRDSVQVNFHTTPSFTLGPDLSKCGNDPVTLSATVPGASYLWNTGSSANSIQVTQAGLYWLEISEGGCKKRDSIIVNSIAYPVVILGNDSTICEGSVLVLNAQNPGASFRWQDNSTLPTYLVTQAGSYWVQVNDQGCLSSDTIVISIKRKPVFTLGPDKGYCQGMQILIKPTVTSTGIQTYLWNDGTTGPEITATKTGNYILTITNSCGSRSDTVALYPGVCKIYVPSGFSPNNDGLNDIFRASFGENVSQFEMDIFNRWGELIYTSPDIRKGWDGKYKNQEQPAGMYVWLIKYTILGNSTPQVLKGTFMLVR